MTESRALAALVRLYTRADAAPASPRLRADMRRWLNRHAPQACDETLAAGLALAARIAGTQLAPAARRRLPSPAGAPGCIAVRRHG